MIFSILHARSEGVQLACVIIYCILRTNTALTPHRYLMAAVAGSGKIHSFARSA